MPRARQSEVFASEYPFFFGRLAGIAAGSTKDKDAGPGTTFASPRTKDHAGKRVERELLSKEKTHESDQRLLVAALRARANWRAAAGLSGWFRSRMKSWLLRNSASHRENGGTEDTDRSSAKMTVHRKCCIRLSLVIVDLEPSLKNLMRQQWGGRPG